MMLNLNLLLVLVSLCLVNIATAIDYDYFEENVKFKFYGPDNTLVYTSNNNADNLTATTGCSPNDKWVFIVHGWLESCEVNYIKILIANYRKYRGGCIICVDYSGVTPLNNLDYFLLLEYFKPISTVLTNKLNAMMKNQLFLAIKGLLFGFSYGSQLIIEAAYNFEPQAIANIDACEPAGPGFDHFSKVDPKLAAKQTQCIHTSIDFGTWERDCTQDWLMGLCGVEQPAVLVAECVTNHGMCPRLYNNAFNVSYPAIEKPFYCGLHTSQRDATTWPSGYEMGYNKPNQNAIYAKTLYAATGITSPYN